ncbi:uncharacterized protein L203_103327 [Cryptococcus depauperatus CBS 7841]|uniref:Uncharacterized protein n=1 Tax=Cryptococcus depauperatus CBS 7841 TaxID=1295531 RepID=A0AAJ8M1X6_9TREE
MTITTAHIHIPPSLPSSPSFHFHLTRLTDTLFVWVGAAPSDGQEASGNGRLAVDWSVAMPARRWLVRRCTELARTMRRCRWQRGSVGGWFADRADSYAARKFPRQQVHLSLDLPASLTQSGPSTDPYASKILLAMEKKLGDWLESLV